MRFAIPAILILLGVFQQMNAQVTNVNFNQLEASQYNIGENGVAWSSSSTLSNFFKLYTTGWKEGKFNTNKPWDYYGPGADGILNYASNNAPPSIYGANGFFGIGSDTNANVQHLLDNHHRVSGLYLLTTIFTNGYSATVTVTNASGAVITTNIGAAPNYTYVNQTNDWSYMTPTQFWSNMLAGEGGTNFAPVSTNANGFWSTTNQPTFLWAYNKGVPQIPTNTPPPMIPGLEDDTLRDVAAQVNYPGDYGFKLKGYQNRDEAEQFDFQGDDGPGEVLFYQEFWWANYLREYVYIPTISNRETAGMNSNAPYQFTDYTQLIAFSADFLCHSSNAAHLPGYYDPGLTSVDFPAFSQGSSFLIGTNGSLDVSGNMFIDQAATLTVKGALSVTNETFYVGKVTSNNTLIISDGGVVTNNNAVIGSSAAATNNSALITGSGSAWFLYGDLIVGEFGSANSMTISNGGQVTNGLSTLGSVIGFGGDSTGNSVLVTGTNVSGVASLWTCVNDLTVGWSGSSNSLRITQGGGVTSYIGIIGDDTNATGNSAVVDGSGSYWSNSNVLLIGVSGSGNSLLITNGGQVMAVNSDIGVNAGSTANMVTVSGVGSVLTNSGDLTVGYGGSSNTLSVSARAKVFSSNSYIGRDPGSTGNTVIVTGTGSLWTNSGDLYVGNQGASNNLVISSGGMVINGGQDSTGGVIGFITNSSNNSVVVTGSGSTWLSAGDVVIGYSGIGNRLEVSNGGTVSNGVVNYAGGLSGGIIGFNEGSTDNSVLVTGTGSQWNSSGDLFVGFNGAGNSMVISNGGSISNSQVDFGGVLGWGAASSNNTVIVTDAGSTWTNSGNLTIGYEGSANSMVISNGGTVAVASNSYIGNASTSSNNSVLVTGEGSLWTNSYGLLVGGEGSSNSLVISNGGTVANIYSYVGVDTNSSNNSVLVTGSNSLWTNSGDLSVGGSGSGNSLVISNGGMVANYSANIGFDTVSSNNSVLVTGSNSLWTNSSNLYVGNYGSSNSLVISNGGMVASSVGYIGVATSSSNNSVLVTEVGSLWTISSDLYVGVEGSGNSLVISNGGRVNSSVADIGFAATSTGNSVLITGSGSTWSNSGNLTIGDAGSGTLTVANGGVLSASRILIGTNGDLDFGRYQQNDTAGNVVTTTIEFTGTNSDDYGINFNQSDTLHLTSSIIGAGWVCQLGTGTSVMSGSNSYSLYTKIDAGTLVAASTNALGTGYLGIGGYADRATLMLATNLTVGDFIWGSNGLVALTAGSQTLTVAGMTNSAGSKDGANVFRFLKTDLSNATNTLINYTSLAGFTTNSFSVSGISGYSFSTNGNQVSAYLSTSANVAVSNSVTINGTLTVNSLTVDPSGTLMGSGTLSLTGGNLTVNGTIAPGNSPGTFFVSGGNLVMGASSVWDQQIYSASVYDRVVVTGSAFLNGTMNITTDGVTQLQFGQKYNFLTASGGISGAFSSIVAPEGFRGRLLLSGNNTQANILIAPASYTQLAANRNQSNVATALNSFIPYTSGDQQVVSTSLDSLTASQYNQAFNAIMPTFYQQIATIAFNNANAQNMQLVQRLWGLRVAEGGGFSMSGLADNMPLLEGQGDGSTGKGVLDSKKDILRPGLDNHWGMFVDGNGIFAQANSGNMLPGYNSQSGGVTTGLTYKWNENVGTGIYCGYQGTYTKSGADGSGLGTGSRLIDNAVRFGVFGTYGQKDGKGLFVNALAGGGYHNFQATRVIQYVGMNRTANSAPGAGELDTMLAAGYDIKKGKFTFGPTASLQYTYLGVNSLNETGAQSLSFNSGGWNSSSMLSSVGAHAAYSWVANKNILVVPQVNLSWQHEFMQNPYAISGNLGGTSPTFSNWSSTPIRDFLYTGVGFTVEFSKRWNTSFFYNAAAGNSDLVSQNIFWSAGIKF